MQKTEVEMSLKSNFNPTNHREFIERKLAEIEKRIDTEGVTIDVLTASGDYTTRKHPLIDAYTQLVQALTKIAPDTVKKDTALTLEALVKADKNVRPEKE